MDYNNPVHFKMPTPIIKLKSSDGQIFQVESKVAQLSLLIKEMLDDLGVDETEVISMPENAPEISGTILEKILQWASNHKDDPAAAEDEDETAVEPTDDISSWDAEFLQVDTTTLFQMIRASNFLNIKGLLDVTCKILAKMIKGMTLKQVRQQFNIQTDFTADEEEQVCKENKWCRDFDSRIDDCKAVDGSFSSKTLADSVQDIPNEGEVGEVIQDCLGNAVVVRKIFNYFSNPELLKLSTLNKLWSHEARLIMRHRGNVMATLVCHNTRPCPEVFRAFGADLEQMNVVMYTGMHMIISPKSHAVGTEALDPTHQIILARLSLKHFSLRLPGNWWDCKDCPTFSLLKKLLQDFSGVLEQLTLDIEHKREEFVEHFVRDCCFSGLKVLNLHDEYYTFDESYTNYMRALVMRAPKLQELHTEGTINLKENVLEGKEAVLFPQQDISAPFDEISESVVDTIRLEHLEMLYTGPQFDLDTFNRMGPKLLQASCTAALRMNVDIILAVPLMRYGISLDNVDSLTICLNYMLSERFQPELMMILKNFDFTRIFPNLEKVGIYYTFEYAQPSPEHMFAILDQADAIFREPLSGLTANINELDLCQKYIPASAVQFFAEMFPGIQKLLIHDIEGEIPFGSIWKNWPDLKELRVGGKFLKDSPNLDSIFCGIFPEEIAQLREKDDEYLKSVNIVPVMPAITCLKNLKTFTLKLSCHDKSDEPFVDDGGTFMFSKVTGLVAFAKCPSLAVNLDFSAHGVLPVSHLKPFASVKCVDFGLYERQLRDYMACSDPTSFIQQVQIQMGEDFETN